ncbi:MAG: hypothetical protein RMK84_05845 [Oscillochloridaceae bacterium]|nr:hypothetical protein [Chloroflexaceae bacterium]MDW8389627.1 hypothetical protein [Oscillochloridaceae bacterium]
MATLVATFTDPRDAAQAAATLQASGFRGVTVGASAPGPSSFLGLGETVESFKNRVILGSTIGGAATGAAALGFLGFVSMGFTEIRNMAMLEDLPGVIIWALTWAIAGLVIGLVAGLLAGVIAARLLADAAERAAAEGKGISRPQVLVPVFDMQTEEAARAILKDVGPFEIAWWR